MVRVSIFLITVALVVGMIGCGPTTPSYNLTIASTEGGSVTIPGEGVFIYDEGIVVDLVAVADECYEFVNWTGDTVADADSATTTITMDGARNVTANFALLSYNLTVDSTDGGEVITPGEGRFTYNCSTVIGLVAEAEEDYSFINWTGDVDTIAAVNNATTTITMNDDYTITANFFQGQVIRDWNDLDAIRDNLGGNYLLMNDLDSTTPGYEELASPTANWGRGWEPIGTNDNQFTGSFDGQGHEIHDLFIRYYSYYEDFVGLFGAIGVEGIVEDVGVINSDVTGYDFVGGLVGWNDGGTVSNSYSTGSVTGHGGVGGLVGLHKDGTVNNCYATGTVTGEALVGGLVGWNQDGTVSNSYATGTVTGTYQQSYAGGLVGFNDWGTVTDSYSTGNVTGEEYVGGLVGHMNGHTVNNCYATGTVTGDDFVGGLVGLTYAISFSSNFWDTETSGQASSAGGTGKTTAEMQDITTFTDTETEGLNEPWDIIAVANPGIRNTSYIWNIVDDETYPFLSWEPVS